MADEFSVGKTNKHLTEVIGLISIVCTVFISLNKTVDGTQLAIGWVVTLLVMLFGGSKMAESIMLKKKISGFFDTSIYLLGYFIVQLFINLIIIMLVLAW